MNRFRKKYQQLQSGETDPTEKKPALRDFNDSFEEGNGPQKAVLAEETKAYIWMWWPYLAALLIFLATTGGTWFFFFKPGEEREALGSRAQLLSLSNLQRFRTAYIEANGGEQKLSALKSIRSSGTFESNGQSVRFQTIKRKPDKSITTLKMPDYDLSFVVNGDMVWQRVEQKGMQPVDTLKEGREAEAMRELGHFFDPLMYVVLYEPESIVSIMPTLLDGKDCLLLEMNSPSRKTEARVYIDPIEMVPIHRIEDFTDGRRREVFYADYRAIDEGMLEPFQVETYMNGVLENRVILEKCTANPGVLSSIFEYVGEE